jgi:hypothetical protein
MKKQIYASNDAFVTPIEQACSEVDLAHKKKFKTLKENTLKIR